MMWIDCPNFFCKRGKVRIHPPYPPRARDSGVLARCNVCKGRGKVEAKIKG